MSTFLENIASVNSHSSNEHGKDHLELIIMLIITIIIVGPVIVISLFCLIYDCLCGPGEYEFPKEKRYGCLSPECADSMEKRCSCCHV